MVAAIIAAIVAQATSTSSRPHGLTWKIEQTDDLP
jgi:hypothetical protein